jgi:hypothetical protein
MRTLAPVAKICVFVMFAYVSLSPERNELFAELVDYITRLGEVAHFGKTFGCPYSFLK